MDKSWYLCFCKRIWGLLFNASLFASRLGYDLLPECSCPVDLIITEVTVRSWVTVFLINQTSTKCRRNHFCYNFKVLFFRWWIGREVFLYFLIKSWIFQGIEALETYIDPSAKPASDPATEPEVTTQPPVVDGATPAAAAQPAQPTPAPPKPVICKKGKCAPYDPTKDKVIFYPQRHSGMIFCVRLRQFVASRCNDMLPRTVPTPTF